MYWDINKLSLIGKKIDKCLDVLSVCLGQRADYFVTTSFGRQSALLIDLVTKVHTDVTVLSIQSQLSYGGVDAQRDWILKNYPNINLKLINRSLAAQKYLANREFFDLDEGERATLCRNLKRPPLQKFIQANAMDIWVTGIRHDQTLTRSRANLINTTDFGVTKIAPLIDWTTTEVHEAMKLLSLRQNEEYIDLCKINQSKECGLHV